MKILILIILSPITLFAQKHGHKEVYYQKKFSDKLTSEGISNLTEVVLFDRTRCDIVTDSFAIEVDFASKWAESIGQSLYYSNVLNKKAGVLLIIEDKQRDEKYLKRLRFIAEKYDITVWLIY